MFYFDRFMDTDGKIVNLKVSSEVTNIEEFAGHGFKRKIDEVDKLVKRHGGKPDDWVKVKGVGTIVRDGIEIKAELHWYEMVDSPVPYDRKIVKYIL